MLISNLIAVNSKTTLGSATEAVLNKRHIKSLEMHIHSFLCATCIPMEEKSFTQFHHS